ncbi:cysteine proteinase [Nadsonia fulvescens var. elongata DSM 6958]|uniref:Ubiquitin carboxyl-terminal hydrolase n=1 Tax=Nadsonia fulvescens var. elongata DSM 6958 TaxID=857566 RepID=A0A1E3PRI8_9ASCO|nr:cysteine proteinase [Nadsonia fulvescens var. elongata DSM 6958]
MSNSTGWNTIESDAGVFTELIEKFGVSDIECQELLSIDANSFDDIQPLFGLIFLFKYRKNDEENMKNEKPKLGRYVTEADLESWGFTKDERRLFFSSQTIQNACATQAILSVLLNNVNTIGEKNLGEELFSFYQFTEQFPPDLIGEAVSNSFNIRMAHNSFSRPVPFLDEEEEERRRKEAEKKLGDDDENDGLFHFVAYVPIGGRLFEFDGLKQGAIYHGAFDVSKSRNLPYEKQKETTSNRNTEPNIESDNNGLLSLSQLIESTLQARISLSPSSELRFNVLALTRDKRNILKETGASEYEINQEKAKRELWTKENSLRRENFLGLIFKLVKDVSAGIDNQNEWQQSVLEKGRAKSLERYNKNRRYF